MQQVLTYQTSYTQDNYQIFSDKIQIGKLYKREWLGSTIDSSINGHDFKFTSMGFFNPVISIIDKKSKQIIGTVKIKNFLNFSPSATLTIGDNQLFVWVAKDIFSYNWQWMDLLNNQTLVNSSEPIDIFRQRGAISLNQQNNYADLLIALGIHLRNVVQRKTVITRLVGLIILALILPRIFA